MTVITALERSRGARGGGRGGEGGERKKEEQQRRGGGGVGGQKLELTDILSFLNPRKRLIPKSS